MILFGRILRGLAIPLLSGLAAATAVTVQVIPGICRVAKT